jgi:hypothetical protein
MSQRDAQKAAVNREGRPQMNAPRKPPAKQDRTKSQWPLWLLISAGVLLPSLLVIGLFKSNKPPISRVVAEAAQSVPVVQVSDAAPSEVIKPVVKMNLMLAENITPNFVDHVGEENGIRMIYFSDGSRRNLDDFTLQQLPEATRFSITYSRGSNANP